MRLLVGLLVILPIWLTAQEQLQITLTPVESQAGWAEKTTRTLKERYQLLGISPQSYTIQSTDNNLIVTLKSERDPIALLHITSAQGVFRTLSVHKYDDPKGSLLYETFSKAKVRKGERLVDLTAVFKLNSFTLSEYKFRRYPPAVLGMTSANNIPAVNKYLQTNSHLKSILPAGSRFCWARTENRLHDDYYDLYLVDFTEEKGVLNESLKEVTVTTKANPFGRVRDLLSVTYDTEGKEQLKTASAQNVDREMVVLIDNYVMTAPLVKGPIETGELEIEGSFTKNEAALYRRIITDLQYPVELKAEVIFK